jgi:hypothetical protein
MRTPSARTLLFGRQFGWERRPSRRYPSGGALQKERPGADVVWKLNPLRVRGIERVRLHTDLTILAKLACALSRARAVPLAA